MAEHTTEAKTAQEKEDKKAGRGHRKELAELRTRAKIVGENIKAANAERDELRAKTKSLKAEMGKGDKEKKDRPEGGRKGEGRRKKEQTAA